MFLAEESYRERDESELNKLKEAGINNLLRATNKLKKMGIENYTFPVMLYINSLLSIHYLYFL